MATITEFEDLKIWQQVRELAKEIHAKSIEGSFARDFALRDQMNRSSGSIMNNIAEGFERDGRQEFIQFLSISKGSAGELRSQLYRALDRSYISQEEFEHLKANTKDISKGLKGFIGYLKKSDLRGTKYKISEPESEYLNNLKLEI